MYKFKKDRINFNILIIYIFTVLYKSIILIRNVWLRGSLCGAQFPKIVSGKSNNN